MNNLHAAKCAMSKALLDGEGYRDSSLAPRLTEDLARNRHTPSSVSKAGIADAPTKRKRLGDWVRRFAADPKTADVSAARQGNEDSIYLRLGRLVLVGSGRFAVLSIVVGLISIRLIDHVFG